jgi:hypothetical protein
VSPICLRKLRSQIDGHAIEIAPCLLDSHPRREPGDCAVSSIASAGRRGADGYPDVALPPYLKAPKTRRGNAADDVTSPVNCEELSKDIGRPGLFRKRQADDGRRGVCSFGCSQPTGVRVHAERRKVIVGDLRDSDAAVDPAQGRVSDEAVSNQRER